VDGDRRSVEPTAYDDAGSIALHFPDARQT
jgi:hypothetical protein